MSTEQLLGKPSTNALLVCCVEAEWLADFYCLPMTSNVSKFMLLNLHAI